MDKLISIINAKIEQLRISNILEAVPSQVIIFLVLSTYDLSFILNDNEEHYFSLAKQYIDPSWIKDSITFSEAPGNRIIYQLIIGNVLRFLSFGNTVFIFRLIFITSYAFILSVIYKTLKFANVQIVIHLAILFMVRQSLFGESWIFVTVESKSFSYVFVLLAILQLMKKRLVWSAIYFTIATYMHVLVGGYSFVYFGLTLFFFNKELDINLKSLLVPILIYFSLVLPFIFFLQTTILSSLDIDLQPSADWIYTYYRNPHHTTDFPIREIFLAFISLLVMVRLKKIREVPYTVNLLTNFAIVSLLGTLLLLFIIFIDSEGKLLKYYLFRINTLSTFCCFMVLVYWLGNVSKDIHPFDFSLLSLLIAAYFTFNPFVGLVKNNMNYFNGIDKNFNDACQYIKSNSDKGDIVFSFVEDLRISRKTKLDRFAVHKFVPADMNKLHDWYYRDLKREEILKNPSLLKEVAGDYNIKYVFSKKIIDDLSFLDLKFSNEDYYVYAVEE